jgi:RHS repeat-associated protein
VTQSWNGGTLVAQYTSDYDWRLNRDAVTLVASYQYGPFGEKLGADWAAPGFVDRNPFRFSTKYTDVETGLVYYGHRYYDPKLGRFLGRDPLGEAGGNNLYGFVRNNPVNRWDILGMVTPEDARKLLKTWEGFNLFLGNGDTLTHGHSGSSVDEVTGAEDFDLVMTRSELEKIAGLAEGGNYYPDGTPVAYGAFGDVQLGWDFGGGLAPNSGDGGLTVGEFVSAAASGAGQGLYNATVGAVVGSYRAGVNQMANAAVAAQNGDYTLAALNGVAAAGNVAGLALTAVGAGQLVNAGRNAIAGTLSSEIAGTFAGGSYTSTVLQAPMTAYRYSGGVSAATGRFLTTAETVSQISSPAAASIALRLPVGATAQTLNTFTVPAGTRIFTGGVAGGADTAPKSLSGTRAFSFRFLRSHEQGRIY